MTSSRRLLCLIVGIAIVTLATAGYAAGPASKPAAPEKPAAPSNTILKGLKPGQVSIVAYYPVNSQHKYIADYLKALEQSKEFKGKVKVEVNDMQTSEGRDKWKTTGLQCAGVFINGKTRWEVVRDGKKETIDFLKRMDNFWTREDFMAVLRQQVKDPKKTPVVPSEKKAKAEKSGGKPAKSSAKPPAKSK